MCHDYEVNKKKKLENKKRVLKERHKKIVGKIDKKLNREGITVDGNLNN